MSNQPAHDLEASALLTDLYQLTMAQGYFLSGRAEHEAVFHLFFRKSPFKGGYAVACGLAAVVEFLEHACFKNDDIRYLAGLTGNDGKLLFKDEFLDYLLGLDLLAWEVDVDAMPEGTAVFPGEPMIRVKGPLIRAQLLETPLLNIMDFQTLIATKASRIVAAAAGDNVAEFGLRRAHGPNGGLSASYAAYVGGCSGTSNALAGKRFGIPTFGTHAHSWVMSFDDELEAFDTYANAMPNNGIFLVDTYDTLKGVAKAIAVGKKLRAAGHIYGGVRLDSGDMVALSKEVRKMHEAAGFPEAKIIASGGLDEHAIARMKQQGAQIDTWGIGERLVTGYDQPVLGCVYKLGAHRPSKVARWNPCMKFSEEPGKSTLPGILQVRRYFGPDGSFLSDAIYDEHYETRRQVHVIPCVDLLVPIYRLGKSPKVYDVPTAAQARQHATEQLSHLAPGVVRRLDGPMKYGVEPSEFVQCVQAEIAKRLH